MKEALTIRLFRPNSSMKRFLIKTTWYYGDEKRTTNFLNQSEYVYQFIIKWTNFNQQLQYENLLCKICRILPKSSLGNTLQKRKVNKK